MKKGTSFLALLLAISALFVLLFSFSVQAQTPLAPINWSVYPVIDPVQSPGFLDVYDMDGDGKKDILLSTLMEQGSAANQATTKGAIRIFERGALISGTWTPDVVLPLDSALPFINYPQVKDVNEDGFPDIIVHQGFINTAGGSHQWLQGPNFDLMHAFSPDTEKGNTDYFWHESEQYDLDGDGKQDIITTSANNSVSPADKKIEWYRHLGNGNFQHYIICDTLGGVFIKLHDVDGDSDMDIVVSQFFGPPASASLVWLEQTAAPSSANTYQGAWTYHQIDHTTGLGYHLEFYDIDLDGQEELVYGNHNNPNNSVIASIPAGVYYFEIPANPAASTQWSKVVIDEGYTIDAFDFGNPASQGAPGIFAIGDVDGNGYPDLVVPGDGMDDLLLLRQKPGNVFVRETVATGRMFGMAKIVDLDGDGKNEIVASMHDFPEVWEILFPPAGHLKIYRPVLSCTPGNLSISSSGGNPLCDGETTVLSVPGAQYVVWSGPLTTSTVTPSGPGTYSCIATNNSGCPNASTITLTMLPPFVVGFSVNGNILTADPGASYQWYLNGNAIPGATGQIYIAMQSGNYSVEVTDANGCSDLSDPQNLTVNGINEYSQQARIFPNPCEDMLRIESPDAITEIELIDMCGRILLKESAASIQQIDVSFLSPGMYVLRYTSGSGEYVVRIQKV